MGGKLVTNSMLASPEEMSRHIEDGNATEFVVPSMSQWSDEEILIFVETDVRWSHKYAGMFARTIALCALLWAAWLKVKSAMLAFSGDSDSKEDSKWTV